MDDYIKRGDLLASFALNDDPCLDFGDAWALVQSAPAADVVEVVHGRWEVKCDSKKKVWCSVCDHRRDIYTQIGWNYCPNCGARMEGGEDAY